MNRDALIAAVAEATKEPQKHVAQILLAALEQIARALRRGEAVALVGFGQFGVSHRRARRGVDPRNPKKPIQIPAVKVVKFTAGKRLKEAVRGE